MAFHTIHNKLEDAVEAYLESEVENLDAITTLFSDETPSGTRVLVHCETAEGVDGVAGNYRCELRVEVRTYMLPAENRSAAETTHFNMVGTIFDLMMEDDLVTELNAHGTAITVHGIEINNTQQQTLDGDELVNSITRQVHCCPDVAA